MSSSNNRLCRLIPLCKGRSDLLKCGQLRAVKKRPKPLIHAVPKKSFAVTPSRKREAARRARSGAKPDWKTFVKE